MAGHEVAAGLASGATSYLHWRGARRTDRRTGRESNCIRLAEAVQVPGIRHALERVLARIDERKTTSRSQVLDRAGDEHLRRSREGGDAGADVDRHPMAFGTDPFDLAGVG